MNISPIIDTSELLPLRSRQDIVIFDVSSGPNARANYEAAHLEGARFVDLNTRLADIKSDFAQGGRHPLPQAKDFAQTLTDFGVSSDSHIIAYDNQGGANAAARLWWMLKSIGHEKVQVLNGGFDEARKNGFPIRSGNENITPSSQPYRAEKWHWPTVTMEEVERAAHDKAQLVIDVRDKMRYDGIKEPIDLIAGHIPGAINIPFSQNLDEQGLFRSPAELKDFYQKQFNGISTENITVHCGSGVTACHTLLALSHAGMKMPNLYVGSWSEWSRNGKPIGVTKAE